MARGHPHRVTTRWTSAWGGRSPCRQSSPIPFWRRRRERRPAGSHSRTVDPCCRGALVLRGPERLQAPRHTRRRCQRRRSAGRSSRPSSSTRSWPLHRSAAPRSPGHTSAGRRRSSPRRPGSTPSSVDTFGSSRCRAGDRSVANKSHSRCTARRSCTGRRLPRFQETRSCCRRRTCRAGSAAPSDTRFGEPRHTASRRPFRHRWTRLRLRLPRRLLLQRLLLPPLLPPTRLRSHTLRRIALTWRSVVLPSSRPGRHRRLIAQAHTPAGRTTLPTTRGDSRGSCASANRTPNLPLVNGEASVAAISGSNQFVMRSGTDATR